MLFSRVLFFSQLRMPGLTLEQARETVTLCNSLLQDPEVVKQIEGAKAMSAGNPMMLMVGLMPIAISTLGPGITPFPLKFTSVVPSR